MIIKPESREKSFRALKSGGLSKKGLSTGFTCLDEHIKLAKGYMAIITGVPSSGKSEFLDAVLMNLTLSHNWRILYYSPENHPVEQHMSKLAEKYIGKHITQFTPKDFDESLEYLGNHFTWMYPDTPQINTLLNIAIEEFDSVPFDCLVIDPWNAVTHSHSNQMIHEYLGEALGKIIRFSRDKNILTCIVAHPTKPQVDKNGCYPVPDLYSISDGAMWRNRADFGIVVHRPDMSKNEVEIYVGKTKYKWMGKVGMQKLDYDYSTGRFKCKDDTEFLLNHEIASPF
jgi:twinkle protein